MRDAHRVPELEPYKALATYVTGAARLMLRLLYLRKYSEEGKFKRPVGQGEGATAKIFIIMSVLTAMVKEWKDAHKTALTEERLVVFRVVLVLLFALHVWEAEQGKPFAELAAEKVKLL